MVPSSSAPNLNKKSTPSTTQNNNPNTTPTSSSTTPTSSSSSNNQREKILQWGQLNPKGWIPSSRHGHSSHIIGDCLYVIGGMENSNRVNSVSFFLSFFYLFIAIILREGGGVDVYIIIIILYYIILYNYAKGYTITY